jgi:hypothetical protein
MKLSNEADCICLKYMHFIYVFSIFYFYNYNSVTLVPNQTIPTERPPLVGEVNTIPRIEGVTSMLQYKTPSRRGH